MLIYIIGPITGKLNDNREAFYAAKLDVRAIYPYAHVLTPHDIYMPDRAARVCPMLCWTEAMAACLPYAEAADIIVALPGWQESRGTRLEEKRRKGGFIEYVELLR